MIISVSSSDIWWVYSNIQNPTSSVNDIYTFIYAKWLASSSYFTVVFEKQIYITIAFK